MKGNEWVYLINWDGTDAVFRGINGMLDQGVDAPYVVCTEHTKEAWEAYLESQIPEPPVEEPTDPDSPFVPIFP